jgi:hypothetical protein
LIFFGSIVLILSLFFVYRMTSQQAYSIIGVKVLNSQTDPRIELVKLSHVRRELAKS